MAAPDLHVYCCHIGDMDAAQLDSYRDLLDAGEQRRLAALRVDALRGEFLASRALLRNALAAHLHADPKTLQFIRDSNDKPQLAPPFSGWHFNLSHSSEWVALAISSAGPVGIDIESHTRRNNLQGIARRFFSAAENASLQQLMEAQGSADDTWLRRFFAIWTLKEAHAKALGCGLAKILSCSSFVPAADFTVAEDRAVEGAVPRTAAIELRLSGAAASAMPVATWLYRPGRATSLAISQLSTRPVGIAMYRCAPDAGRDALETYFEPTPIAAGSWLPDVSAGPSTGTGTQTDNPRA